MRTVLLKTPQRENHKECNQQRVQRVSIAGGIAPPGTQVIGKQHGDRASGRRNAGKNNSQQRPACFGSSMVALKRAAAGHR